MPGGISTIVLAAKLQTTRSQIVGEGELKSDADGEQSTYEASEGDTITITESGEYLICWNVSTLEVVGRPSLYLVKTSANADRERASEQARIAPITANDTICGTRVARLEAGDSIRLSFSARVCGSRVRLSEGELKAVSLVIDKNTQIPIDK